jgi:hypothetical protein
MIFKIQFFYDIACIWKVFMLLLCLWNVKVMLWKAWVLLMRRNGHFTMHAGIFVVVVVRWNFLYHFTMLWSMLGQWVLYLFCDSFLWSYWWWKYMLDHCGHWVCYVVVEMVDDVENRSEHLRYTTLFLTAYREPS